MSAPLFNAPLTNPFGLSNVGTGGHASPSLVDIDGDGDLDAFIGNQFGDVLFFRNVGTSSTANFSAPTTNPFDLFSSSVYLSPTFADIDADGDLDAFVGNSVGNVLFFDNIGTASNPIFSNTTLNAFGLTNVGLFVTPALADIDGDGDLDAFVGNSAGNLWFYRNSGTANNASFDNPVLNPFGLTHSGYFSHPSFVDIDRDGDLDAFVGNAEGNSLFFLNTGTANTPVFAAPVTNPFALTDVGFYASPTFADIDHDGDADAFIGNLIGNTQFYLNVQPPNIAPVLKTPATVTYTDTAFVDTFAVVTDKLMATDANVGDTLSYGIVGGIDHGATVTKSSIYGTLTVTKTTGDYSFTPASNTLQALGATVTNSTLKVTVTDNGAPHLSASKSFSVTITQQGNTETMGNDNLVGNASNNTFHALAGNDIINGAQGADSMTGGSGNDSYYVDNSGDKVIETSSLRTEIDTVYSSLNYTLGTNVERLNLIGSAAINGIGNALNNTLKGNNAANQLTGGNGSDTLNGGLGKDTFNLIETLAATDTVQLATGDSLSGAYDVVYGFKLGKGTLSNAGVDKLDLASTHIAANAVAVNGVDANVIRSHHLSNGMISFDDVNNYTSPLAVNASNLGNVINYLTANISASNTVAFLLGNNTFIYQDGGVHDTVIELLGVSAHSLNTTGLAANTVWLV